MVCESEAQRLAPIMTLQINIIMCGGSDRSLPQKQSKLGVSLGSRGSPNSYIYTIYEGFICSALLFSALHFILFTLESRVSFPFSQFSFSLCVYLTSQGKRMATSRRWVYTRDHSLCFLIHKYLKSSVRYCKLVLSCTNTGVLGRYKQRMALHARSFMQGFVYVTARIALSKTTRD